MLACSSNGQWLATTDATGAYNENGERQGFADVIQIRNANTGEIVLSMDNPQHEFSSMTWSPDNIRLAMTGIDEVTLVWDTQQNKIAVSFPVGIDRREDFGGYYRMKNSVAWSPDGTKLAGVGTGESIYIWDAETYALIHEIRWEGE